MDYLIIKDLAQQRAAQLGGAMFHTAFKDLVISPGETKIIEGGGDSYFILESDTYMTIESDNGFYDNNSPIFKENEHEHIGTIKLTNNIDIEQRVKFMIISYMANKK